MMMDMKEHYMTNKGRSEAVWLRTASLVILAVVALGFALTYTRAVMVPFVLALFIVSIVSPILDVLVIPCRGPDSRGGGDYFGIDVSFSDVGHFQYCLFFPLLYAERSGSLSSGIRDNLTP
jgi:hypothetical protein